MKMAGPLHPHFLFFFQKKKENGPCTVQKRKRSTPLRGGTEDRSRARGSDRFLRMSPARGVVRTGVSRAEWTCSSFRCRTPVVEEN